MLCGKYMNGYHANKPARAANYVPPGWTNFYGFQTVAFFGTAVNKDGVTDVYPADNYQTDIIANISLHWMRDVKKPDQVRTLALMYGWCFRLLSAICVEHLAALFHVSDAARTARTIYTSAAPQGHISWAQTAGRSCFQPANETAATTSRKSWGSAACQCESNGQDLPVACRSSTCNRRNDWSPTGPSRICG